MDLGYLLFNNDTSNYSEESDLSDKQFANILISQGWLKDEVKNFDI